MAGVGTRGVASAVSTNAVERTRKLTPLMALVGARASTIREILFTGTVTIVVMSDEASVFVNGVPLYGGTNRCQSRDYRYLGTIGLFDEVYLPLRDGRNEVRFVVTEAFGGWGLQARFEDTQGIEFQAAIDCDQPAVDPP